MEDREIVDLYWARNSNAIKETASKYGAYCKTIAKNILGNHEDAEECVNDTYLQAWNSIPPHRPDSLSAYLGKITRNLSFDRFRHNRADKRGNGETELVLDELGECVSGADSVEREVAEIELIGAINAFLASLPAKKRQLFVCRYWYADDIKDIAERFEMTENNVSVALCRIRARLRSYLLKSGIEL